MMQKQNTIFIRLFLIVFTTFSFIFMLHFVYKEYVSKLFSDKSNNFIIKVNGLEFLLKKNIQETIKIVLENNSSIHVDVLEEILNLNPRIIFSNVQRVSSNKIIVSVQENNTLYLLHKNNILKEVGFQNEIINEEVVSINPYLQWKLPIITMNGSNVQLEEELEFITSLYQKTYKKYPQVWEQISEILIKHDNNLNRNIIHIFSIFSPCKIIVYELFPEMINQLWSIFYYLENVQIQECTTIELKEEISILKEL